MIKSKKYFKILKQLEYCLKAQLNSLNTKKISKVFGFNLILNKTDSSSKTHYTLHSTNTTNELKKKISALLLFL